MSQCKLAFVGAANLQLATLDDVSNEQHEAMTMSCQEYTVFIINAPALLSLLVIHVFPSPQTWIFFYNPAYC